MRASLLSLAHSWYLKFGIIPNNLVILQRFNTLCATDELHAGLRSFSGTKIKKIVALPVFLASGAHVSKDIEILLAEPLGTDECIANLAYRH
jgi:hypothetical protein